MTAETVTALLIVGFVVFYGLFTSMMSYEAALWDEYDDDANAIIWRCPSCGVGVPEARFDAHLATHVTCANAFAAFVETLDLPTPDDSAADGK